MKKQIITMGIVFLAIHNLNAQSLSIAETKNAIDTLVSSYFRAADIYATLYSGKEHVKYAPWVKGHPFYKTDQYVKGSVYYDGLFYPDVNLRLDLYTDELLVQTSDQRYNIIIPGDKVEWAEFHSHKIIRHHRNRNIPGSPPTGYYIQLHESENTLWERQIYEWKETIVDQRLEVEFLFKNRFYIIRNGVFHPVKSKASVLKLFQPKKSELKHFIKRNKLSFRHDPAEAIRQTVQYYESITL